MWCTPVLLENEHVRLEPLGLQHHGELHALDAEAHADESVWRFAPMDADGGPFARWLDLWFAAALPVAQSGREVIFAVRDQRSGTLVGSTRYLNLAEPHRRVEIGGTWYVARGRGTHVNPACKLLLLSHSFERLGCVRTELKCDLRNLPSQRGIEKLGAKREGVFRKHMVLGDGYIRDTVYYSILDEEWPTVRAGLLARLA